MPNKIKICSKRECGNYNKGSKTNCLKYDNPANIQQQLSIKECKYK